MKCIAFIGSDNKDDAASYLSSNHNFMKINFSTPFKEEIKFMMHDYLEAEAEYYNCSLYDLMAIEPGAMKQFIRSFSNYLKIRDGSDYWINQWLTKANHFFVSQNKDIVITDLETSEEYSIISKIGGTVIRICEEGEDNINQPHIIPHFTINIKKGDVVSLCIEVQKIYETIK